MESVSPVFEQLLRVDELGDEKHVLTELQKILDESQEEDLSFKDELCAQKKQFDEPLEHSYGENSLWSQSQFVTTTQKYEQENQIDVSENDITSQNAGIEDWVDQFFNLKKNDNPVSGNISPLNSDSAEESSSSLCSQKPAESSVETVNSLTNPPDTTTPSSSLKSRKRKASGYSAESDAGESVLDRSTKNAIAARENRLKKKLYVEGLEKKNQELKKENEGMLVKMEEQEDKISQLEREVKYLKNVLHNESAYHHCLEILSQTPV